jgi:hypothetical protein
MNEPDEVSGGDSRGGDQRGGDRRRRDRRRTDRRTPLPVWRRPPALVAYGVVGALLVMLILRGFQSEDTDGADLERIALEEARTPPELPTGVAEEAFSMADYERLVADGEASVGRLVRVDLYCASMTSIGLRDVEWTHPRILDFADSEGRIAGAECRWGPDGRTSDLVLLVPPQLSDEFAELPQVELNFVRRRHVRAEIEWLGRSDALSLRHAGVLLDIHPAS